MGYPSALTWVVLVYATVAVSIGWAYAISRIHADYVQTMEFERNRLRDVTVALQSATLAMLNDWVGSAVAGANELQSIGGIQRATSNQLLGTLKKQLVREVLSSGAQGYVLKSYAGRILVAALDAMLDGDPTSPRTLRAWCRMDIYVANRPIPPRRRPSRHANEKSSRCLPRATVIRTLPGR